MSDTPHQHVVYNAQMGNQIVILIQNTNIPAQAAKRSPAQPTGILTQREHAARTGLEYRREQPKQRRFARPGRADDCDPLTLKDLQVNVRKHRLTPERSGYVLEAKDRGVVEHESATDANTRLQKITVIEPLGEVRLNEFACLQIIQDLAAFRRTPGCKERGAQFGDQLRPEISAGD